MRLVSSVSRLVALALLVSCSREATVEQVRAVVHPATSVGVALDRRPVRARPAKEHTAPPRRSERPAPRLAVSAPRRETTELSQGTEDVTAARLPNNGTIFAHGGGPLGRESQRRLAELCQHGDLVLIPTANKDADKPRYREFVRERWLSLGLASVSVVHAETHERASAGPLVSRVRAAECVWLGGGAQGPLVRRYRGTPIERELFALLDRGGVVGGYSAGTSSLTEVMIRYGNPEPVAGRGFGLIGGVIFDQHFLVHRREQRRLSVLEQFPELVGFGIDEGTALGIYGDRFEVVGESIVRRCTHQRGCVSLAPGATGRFPRGGSESSPPPP